MKTEKTHIHKNHRQRLKRRFIRSGADSFETHHLLEMLLFYAIPQRDTNPLAHELMEIYGSLDAVLHADYESLTEVCGVKENTAVLIKLVQALICRCDQEVLSRAEVHSDFESVGHFLVKQYRTARKEMVYLLLFDNSGRLLDVSLIHEGSVNSAMVDNQKIAKLALLKNASNMILSHNHPDGLAIPSSDDSCSTRKLSALFSALGIPLLDHYIVAGNRYYGIISGKSGTVSDTALFP